MSAAFGPTALRLGDVISADEFGRVFRTWALSDASGVLVVAPAVLIWATTGLRGIRRRDVVEGAVGFAVLILLAEVAPQRDVPYIVFPVLLWAALRLGPRGASMAILVVCSITVWNTAQEDGPFVRDSITDSLLATQLFIATAALTSLLLAAVTAERLGAARALGVSEAAQRALADEQAALRRVAALVAAESPPSHVFQQVTEEVGRLLGLPRASIVQYRGGHNATVVGAWRTEGDPRFPVGASLDLDGDTVSRRCCAPALPNAWSTTRRSGAWPRRARRGVPRGGGGAGGVAGGCGGRWWRRRHRTSRCRRVSSSGCSTLRISSGRRWPTPTPASGWPHRVPSWWRSATPSAGDSSAICTTARSSGYRRSAPAGPGRREAREPIRRPPASFSPRRRSDLQQGIDELRELARGLHPVLLTERGLGPALDALATRAPVPVEIEELPEERLAAPVEAAAYYVVAEAVTNVAKYARASRATVSVRQTNGYATVTVRDDGVGGADPSRGSGLRGLAARVEALNGRLDVDSAPQRGTRIRAEIPVS